MRWSCTKNKWRCLVLVLSFIVFLDIYGVFVRMWEKDYQTEFAYPLEINLTLILHDIRNGVKPTIAPLNDFKYVFLTENSEKCLSNEVDSDIEQNVTLLLVVKSAVGHFHLRHAIRNSWGKEDQLSKETIRRIFVVGESSNDLQTEINREKQEFGDIVQVAFLDTYFNNTIKSMASISWVVHNCPKAELVLFVDDDFYISVKNLLNFARHPVDPPSQIIGKTNRTFDGRLYGGYVYSVRPMRYKFAKWYMSLQEYPYSEYPPFVMGGASVMSSHTLKDIYHAMKYTRTFRLDDVYLGIVAKKAGIAPVHNPHFYKWKREYDKNSFGEVIASHEYNDPEELTRVWREQKEIGNA